ncbi:DUF4235 domain-containing protein [Actinosynnema pretiosum subsp. pretiosum]|uniref:Integral membrane protein n=3 Tax=Actinosynnema TaxID=40566 RepID=C6WCU9_ACTMD|nr:MULTISPECIES: DUF4235 domain-containing protein [Actinosynnema]ACU35716.1 conserved hypothetical protein [Actinosynnema mirum DSM 43827]ATE53376.1 DUF4235 domain-containing protein [Actinosynnema pretiosum]AXX29141.1 putative integral membrane protein [Actinosynnema pretiosum subsp. pretiosum]QUF06585.1 DUF4235 domain-containing protein [Actinosynnema pretiosum subsp. pretiosum]
MAGKLVYRGFSTGVSLLGGYLAGKVFGQVWKLISGDRMAPEPTQRDRSWGEVLLAAAVQGAIFGLVRAAIDRGGATGFSKVTGEWPGETADVD